MQLLVSVRSGLEVAEALAGGADLIDAKEPSRGPLGPVDRTTLRGIVAQLPSATALSLALGDHSDPAGVAAALTDLDVPERSGPSFVKLGCAGISCPERIGSLVASAIEAAARIPLRPTVIVVAYADSQQAGTASPGEIGRVAVSEGAGGVLIDTFGKSGGNLFDWISSAELGRWLDAMHRAGLVTAVAGSLDTESVTRLGTTRPGVVGVRGAACVGGRGGQVSASRVRALKRALERLDVHRADMLHSTR